MHTNRLTHCLTKTSCVASCLAIIAMAGCARQESPAQAQADINRTEASDNRDVASAQKQLDLAAATEARDVAKKRCETESGDARSACDKQADADYDAAKAQAEATQSATDSSQPR